MRLVLDTNVVVSALLWDGGPRKLLSAGRRGEVELYSSAQLLRELTDVLSRRKFHSKIAASQLSVDQIVDLYAELAALVRPVPVPRIVSDPDDDAVIATALAAKADLIVTGDKALLSIDTYENLRVVSVAEALRLTVQAESGKSA
jgi:putative PIN family toxin of toxin-antitoxin system